MNLSRSVRAAALLWILWAIVAWNVVLDQVIVLAARRYIVAAIAAAQSAGPYARIDDWMQPAIARGFWLANLVGGVILLVGFILVRLAARCRPRAC